MQLYIFPGGVATIEELTRMAVICGSTVRSAAYVVPARPDRVTIPLADLKDLLAALDLLDYCLASAHPCS